MRKYLFIAGLLASTVSMFAQQATVSWEARIGRLRGTCGDLFSGSSCWESSDLEYSARIGINTSATTCYAANISCNGDYGQNGGATTGTGRSLTTWWEFWEDDTADRCTYNSCCSDADDCHAGPSTTGIGFFNASTATSPSSYTHWFDYLQYNSGGSQHYMAIAISWRYTGTASLLGNPAACTEPSAAYGSGIVPSWTIPLTAGVTYRFRSSVNHWIRVYAADGYSIVAQGAAGGSGITYAVPSSTNYYIEITNGNDRNNVGAAGTMYYSLLDQTAPSISACAGTVNVGTNSGCTATGVSLGSPTASDACGISSVTNNAPSAFPLGATTVTWTVRDPSNNAATCTQTVNVSDDDAPSATCPATVNVGTNSGCTATGVALGSPSTSDNCGVTSVTNNAPSAFNLGATTVTWTVRDAANNATTCTQTVNVSDDDAPTGVTCPATVNVTTNSGCTATGVSLGTPSGTDNCTAAASLTKTNNAPSAYNLGATTVTWTVRDAANNATTCTQTVNVSDDDAPSITCPANITVSNALNTCAATVSYTAPVGTDNCSGATTARIGGLASGSSFPVGTTTNTFQVTDGAGLTATCSFTVTVNDTQAPTISCPSNQTLVTAAGQCDAVTTFNNPGFGDNCAGASVAQTVGLSSGSAFPKGTTTNTFTATDASGNTTTCSFTVTVNDTESPQITCPADITVSTDAGACTGTASWTAPVGTDNCPGQTTSQTAGLAPGSTTFDKGTTTNTYTVTDASGNTTSCSFTVTVNDTESPQIACPSDISVNTDAGLCTAVVAYAEPAGTDNCSGAVTIRTAGDASGAAFGKGTTTNTYMVMDASGNTAECSFTVTVTDAEAPQITCPSDMSVATDAGECAALVNYTTPAGTDNCPGQSTAQTSGQADGTSFPKGSTVNTFVVTDAEGQTAECSFTVTVSDTENPTISCPADQTVGTDAGVCEAVVNFDDATYADNCSGSTVALTGGQASGSSFAKGVTYNTFTVTDASGNTAECSFTVTVLDDENPTIACPSDIVVATDLGQCSALVLYADVTYADNCLDPSTLAQTAGQASGTSFPKGNTTNTFVVTDAVGLTAECSFIVTVNDEEAPVIACPADMTVNTDAGECSAVTTWEAPGVSGGGGVITTYLTYNEEFQNFNGVVPTTQALNWCSYRSTLVAGLSYSSLTIKGSNDMVGVTCSVPSVVAQIAEALRTATPGSWSCGGHTWAVSTDYCGGDPSPCDGSGGVSLFIDDEGQGACGCTGGPGYYVRPEIGFDFAWGGVNSDVCGGGPDQSLIVQIGVLTTTSGGGGSGASDNCPGAYVTQTGGLAPGSVFPLGTSSVEYTVTDAVGLTATCSFTVTVEDHEAPTAVCQDVEVQLDATGNGGTTAAAVDNGSNDACGIASISLSQTAFTCANVGANTETLTVIDNNGNVSSCDATVTVIDDVDPVAICQDVTVDLDATGNGNTTAAAVDNGSNDACGIATLALSQTAFVCSEVGPNTETLTVTDVNGNVSTCTANVEVEDNVAPVAICQDVTVQLNASGNGSTSAAAVNNGSNDACGIATLALSQTTFVCSEVGPNTETLTVTDVNGNVSTCTANVEVEDNVAPVAICQNVTVQLNAAGVGNTTAAAVNNGSNDACGIASLALSQTAFVCSEVGPNTETLTVTDVNGNVSTCNTTVTVRDLVAPQAVCQNVTVDLSTAGTGTTTAAAVNNGSSDACGIASLSLSKTSFNCSNIGSNPVTLTVTDVNSNVSTCSATVTVRDLVAPVAICQNVTVQLNSAGTGTTTAAAVNNGSSDACGIASLSLSQTNFNCLNISGGGPADLFISEYIEGSSNNKYIELYNGTGSSINLSNYQLRNYSNGSATPTTTSVLSGTLAPGATIVYKNSAATAYAGTATALSAVNFNGNDAIVLWKISTNAAVDIFGKFGNDPVTAWTLGGNTTVDKSLRRKSNVIAGVTTNPTGTGPAAFTTLATEWDQFNIDVVSGLGSHTLINGNTVTLTVTDVNGNSSTCTASVKVEDNVAPAAVCQNVTVDLNSSGNGTTTAAAVNNGSSDACGIASLSLSKTSFNCSNVGNNAVTLTVTDVNSNSSTCAANVLVRDLVAPVAVCQAVTVDLNAAGTGSITPAQVNNGSSDACGIAGLSLNNTNFGCANVGSGNTVTLTVTDVNGNSSTCVSTITVRDLVVPVALCQTVTVQLDATGNGTTTAAAVNNGSNDACGIASLVLNQTAFNCASIVYTAPSELFISEYIEGSSNNKAIELFNGTGSAINLATAGYNLFISFNGGTSTTTINLTGTIPAGGTYVVANTAANAAILGIANQTGNVSFNGNDAVVLRKGTTNIDIFGRIGNDPGAAWTGTSISTVDKTLRRKSSVQAGVTTNPTGTGSGAFTTLSSEWEQYAIDNSAGLGSHAVIVDGNNPVTLTVTDVNGNSSSCFATVVVEDNVAPVANCQNITVQLDVNGEKVITAEAVNNGSSDACGIASLALNQTFFECANLGNNTVTLTVTDVNGNASTCTGTVTVEDRIAPVAICQDVQVYLDETGFGFTTEQLVNNGSTDACGLLPQCPPTQPNATCLSGLMLNKKTFDCSEVGEVEVLLYVTDISGNTAVCTSTVTVIDAVLPVALCQDVTVQLDATGNGSTTAEAVDNGSNDACGIQSISLSQTAFVCSEVGPNTVTLTVTDVNGNVNTCSANVEVEDNVAPVALCQDVTIQLDASGNASTTATAVDNGSNDACGIATIELSQTAFVCTEVGPNTETLTVTDVNGNVSTCTANVEVQDNVAPVAICQDVTVQLDENGNGSTTATAVDNGSNDACGVASLVLSQTDFVCSEVGPNTETLTVTDVNGNVSTCTANVEVEDNVAPVATCQPVTVQLDATGHGSTTAADVNNNSTDACGIASLALSQTAFVCSEVGDNLETLTVTDVNGNVSTCITTVTVEDNVAPIALCQDVTVQLDASGNGSTTAVAVNNGSNDACGIASLVLSQTDFVCSEVGPNTETLTVTDVNGNVSTCTANVEVEDNIAPVAICQNVTVQLDASGNGSTTPQLVDNGSNDACGIASLVLSQTAFVCSEVGPNTETLTVTDVNGNVSTCTANVEVEDNVAPVALCQNVTVTLAGGTYTVTPGQIDNGSNDACGIASLSVDPNTFTCAHIGDNAVTLTVTDVNGNVSTCGATVTVVGTIPTVNITGSNLPSLCQGQEFILTANPNEVVSFAWNTGETTQAIDVYASGNYTVVITNQYGCKDTADYLLNYTPTSYLSSYVMLAQGHIHLRKSVVNDGGVGITGTTGHVHLKDISTVTDAGTFIKSPDICIQPGSASTTNEYVPAGVTLPPFYKNPYNNNNHVTVAAGATVTLTGTNYGNITVKDNATVIFTQSNVYIKKFDAGVNATVRFNGCTNLMVQSLFKLGGKVKFNPTQQPVTVYQEGQAQIGAGATVYSNIIAHFIHAMGATGSSSGQKTLMYGQFIAHHIHSGNLTEWNYSTACGSCLPSTPSSTIVYSACTEESESCDGSGFTTPSTPTSSFTGSSLRVGSYPNPFSTTADITFTSEVDAEVKVTVLSPAGDEVDMLFNGPVKAKEENKVRFNAGSDKASGIYFYRVQSTTGETEVGKMMLLK